MNSAASCSIIIVTYNSQKHIEKAMQAIQTQTLQPNKVIIVDTGSEQLDYLERYKLLPQVQVIVAEKNSGFCKGNNVGMTYVPPESKYVFFLNPDAFLTPNFLKEALAFMEMGSNNHYGAVTGTLLGYDIETHQPTGTFDSTGVFQRWFGKWYDRSQGQLVDDFVKRPIEDVPAICGAAFLARKQALDSVLLRQTEVFDSTFYMYKEDIDLSLRLQNKAWKLAYLPALQIYHCRGWQSDRSKMPRQMRLAAARNECRIHWRLKKPIPIAYSLLKFAVVNFFDK